MHRATAYVASPGGSIVTVGGKLVGEDPVGLAAWVDWTATMHHRVLDLTPLFTNGSGGSTTVVLAAGCGAWCPNTAPTWLHSHRIINTAAGALPVLRALIVLEDATGAEILVTQSGDADWSSRVGVVVDSSSWTGSTMNHTLLPDKAWVSPARRVPAATVQSDIAASNRALSVPPPKMAATGLSATRVVSVAGSGSTPRAIVYTFPRMVVGVASIAANAWAAGPLGGAIRIEYCEVLEDPAAGTCVRQGGYTANGTRDIHLLPPQGHQSSTTANLTTQFSWRGFQYAVVTAVGGATFRGELDDVVAHWVGAELPPTAAIAFDGDGSEMFARINALVQLGLSSNLVSGMPTDCPTREK